MVQQAPLSFLYGSPPRIFTEFIPTGFRAKERLSRTVKQTGHKHRVTSGMKIFEINRLTCFPIRYIVFSLCDSPLRLQSHNYEERYRTVEGELRKLVAMRGKSLAHFVPCLLQFIPEMDL